MKKKGCRVVTIILLVAGLLCTSAARAQEPTNPVAAVLKSHIMLTPAEIKWGECPPALPRGAQCAVTEGDLKAANALFG